MYSSDGFGLPPDRLGSLLTASVIISMSLTPLLGELAEFVGDAVERIDAGQEANSQADALFDVIDVDRCVACRPCAPPLDAPPCAAPRWLSVHI